MPHLTESEEKEYLKYVQQELQAKVEYIDEQIKKYHEEILEMKRYMYENQAQLDNAEKALNRVSVFDSVSLGEDALRQKEKITKLIQSPYFGRIDFQQAGDTGTFYIGIYGFSGQGTSNNLIYDWRAPVSSMFYDFELGNAFYLAPAGKIEGNLCLKRQYKIEKAHMEYMIESSLNIGDEVLQKELSQNSNEKMKNIVATIQKEQNVIIRNETAKVLIIQGAAGSGKTSIALHRIAFLLYRQKGSLDSQNVLIISPNQVFADYISNVLPELGEENMLEMSFDQVASEYLGKKYKYRTFSQQVESLLYAKDLSLQLRIAYKSSNEFVEQLQQFLNFAAKEYFVPKEICFGNFYISQRSLWESYCQLHNYPIKIRLKRIADKVIAKLKNTGKKLDISSIRLLRKGIENMYTVKDALSLYQKFYEYMDKKEYFCFAAKNTFEYSDLFPFIYTKIFYEGITTDYSKIKHLLIDEMQDYTPIQYAVLSKLFSCQMTILGDAYQSVNPYSSSTAEKISPYFSGAQIVEVSKSYRSTWEIAEFARNIINNQSLRSIERHGSVPSIIETNNADEEFLAIKRLISKFKASPYSSLGIICKSQKDTNNMYQKLRTFFRDIVLLDFESTSFEQGIVITSVQMSKGLEFDQVIIPQVSQENYHTDMERSLLYIACTRAMHKLDLTYNGTICEFLSGAKPED